MNTLLKKSLPHIVAVGIFIIASYVYFAPLMQGKGLPQHDIEQFKGSAKELIDYREATGEEALWTNSMFGGMPAYLVSTAYKGNLLRYVDKALSLVQRPGHFMFLALLGFYILMLVFGVNPWLAIVGAFAYGLSSYFFIVIAAGHNAKMHAMAYVAPMVAGLVLAYKGKYLGGLALFALFFGLNINTGHPQITYYAAFVMFAIAVAYFVDALKNKNFIPFGKATAVLLIGATLAVGANVARLYYTYDYGKDSIRGPSELTRHAENQTSGLDRDYATAWSYGIGETFNLLIPNLYGGSSTAGLGSDSETYNFLITNGVPRNQAKDIVKQMPAYWGDQPITSGPVYVGAIVFFLFVLGLFMVRGALKWALLAVTVLGIALAWGHNLPWLTNLFLDYFPGYNKFRTVSMILFIAEFTMPLLGMLAVKQLYDGEITRERFLGAVKWSVGLVGGFCLLLILFGSALFTFEASVDQQYISAGYPEAMFDAVRLDRASLLRADTIRSLVFILLAVGVMVAFFFKKLKPAYFIAVLGLLIVTDLWVVNRRYLGASNFKPIKSVENPFIPTAADKQIMADKTPYFRVFNLTVSPFNDASTSFFHKSIGGYHGAKMRRYQELIEYHISKQNFGVINMLNVRYIIQSTKEGQPVALFNDKALGNAWFVNSVIWAQDADAEIDSLTTFNPAMAATIDVRFKEKVKEFSATGGETDTIALTEYAPNRLAYKYKTESPRLTVFSDIYYQKGWVAYINGETAEHFRVNYVLRGMVLPAGENEVVFEFKPTMFSALSKVELASSLLIILLVLGWIATEFLAYRKEELSK
jgi:hypothetical protein